MNINEIERLSNSSIVHYNRVHAIRLPASFPVSSLAAAPVLSRLKSRSSWRTLAAADPATVTTLGPFRSEGLASPCPLWDPPKGLLVSPSLPCPCPRSLPAPTKLAIFQDVLSSFPSADVVFWSDGSVVSPNGQGGAGVSAVSPLLLFCFPFLLCQCPLLQLSCRARRYPSPS